MKSTSILFFCLALVITIVSGCGGGQSESKAEGGAEETGGLTAWQMENGIGPVTSSVALGELDPELAEKGEETFKLKCSACHKIDKRYVGPALGDVLSRRTPAYVMNMILNPEGMLAEHPEAKKLLGEYMTPMANQNLTEAEARSIVEYFRTTETPAGETGEMDVDSSENESD